MLCNTHNLTGFALHATDGDIGAVEDFYFDDYNWTVRYLVADTGKWIPGRKVLISPISLGNVDAEQKQVSVNLTREQIKNSPDIDAHKPISRQHETAVNNYYGYPYYWSGPYLWGPTVYPTEAAAMPPPIPDAEMREIQTTKEKENSEDNHLRSTREVTNYYIEARDGGIGHVEEFLIDDVSWTIQYIVVDTRNWWPGKKVLVSPRWINDVSWPESAVHVDLTRESIKTSPEYNESAPISRDYEKRLWEHYRRTEHGSRDPGLKSREASWLHDK